MTLKTLPVAPEASARPKVEFNFSERVQALWNPALRAEASDVIQMYGTIGEDWFSEGITAKSISEQLDALGGKDVTVSINSPGGDMFEGLAIYNLLRNYKGSVTVQIIGLAASAASVIAMAGDEIQISSASFLMIHNAWTLAIGNQHDFRELADTMSQFDEAMAGIYSSVTGIDAAEITQMMDDETYINGASAVEQGFADALLPSEQIKEVDSPEVKSLMAAREADRAFAKAGMPRSRRRQLIQTLKSGQPTSGGTHDAAPTVTHDADLSGLLASLKELQSLI